MKKNIIFPPKMDYIMIKYISESCVLCGKVVIRWRIAICLMIFSFQLSRSLYIFLTNYYLTANGWARLLKYLDPTLVKHLDPQYCTVFNLILQASNLPPPPHSLLRHRKNCTHFVQWMWKLCDFIFSPQSQPIYKLCAYPANACILHMRVMRMNR